MLVTVWPSTVRGLLLFAALIGSGGSPSLLSESAYLPESTFPRRWPLAASMLQTTGHPRKVGGMDSIVDKIAQEVCDHPNTDIERAPIFGGARWFWHITCQDCGFVLRLDDDGVPLDNR